jgi:hypothetical protein
MQPDCRLTYELINISPAHRLAVKLVHPPFGIACMSEMAGVGPRLPGIAA